MNRRNFLKGFLASGAVIALAPLMPIVEVPIESAKFEELMVTTLNEYRKILVENITRQNGVFTFLLRKGYINAGEPISFPVITR